MADGIQKMSDLIDKMTKQTETEIDKQCDDLRKKI